MHCKNCGYDMDDLASVCTNCGAPKKDSNKYCLNCNNEISPNNKFCPVCGVATDNQNQTDYQNHTVNGEKQKSKIAAGILGILLGVFGIHNFYLGYTSKAITQLLLGTVGVILCGLGPVASGIWGLVEGIQILTGSIDRDGNGVPLVD